MTPANIIKSITPSKAIKRRSPNAACSRRDCAADHSKTYNFPMKIAVTGSTGLVGSALIPLLESAGHEVVRLRRPAQWDPEKGAADPSAFGGVDAVVHLAGENIAGGRWTAARKERILNSRVKGTKLIAETLGNLPKPPQVLVSASAIGYYGDRGSELLREQ